MTLKTGAMAAENSALHSQEDFFLNTLPYTFILKCNISQYTCVSFSDQINYQFLDISNRI